MFLLVHNIYLWFHSYSFPGIPRRHNFKEDAMVLCGIPWALSVGVVLKMKITVLYHPDNLSPDPEDSEQWCTQL